MSRNSVLVTLLPSWSLAVSFSKPASFYVSGSLCRGMMFAPAPPSSCSPECGCPLWNEIPCFGYFHSLKWNAFDRPHIVDHKQNEFFPIFKELLSFLSSRFKIENMLSLLLLKHPHLLHIYRETRAVDMPKGKCRSDAKADEALMVGLSSSACCSQTQHHLSDALGMHFYRLRWNRQVPSGSCSVPPNTCSWPWQHFPACSGVGGDRR